MLLPSAVIDINDLFGAYIYWSNATQPRMNPGLFEIALIFTQLVLHVCRCQKQSLIQ
ncbi:hypothetical protein NOR53_2504 [gamma proteobacterium NOR5-3]|nr:hypothetical protein NOR53_2504 [gamma proteobacterium NOR5-3]